MLVCLLILSLLAGVSVCAPGSCADDADLWMPAALVLSGAGETESLDGSELERYEALHSHPVPLNLASRSRLLSSGLLSAYQVASLLDYRSRNGDILSAAELGLVDGFDPETAAALSYFVSFRSATLPGQPVSDTLRGRVRQHTELRTKGPSFKYRMAFAERAGAGIAIRSGYDPVFYGVYYGDGRLGKVVAGNFHIRLGQGLALWTGFVIDDLLSPSAYVRRSGGISPSWSYTGEGTWRGMGADFLFGQWDLAVFAAKEGLGVHAGWSWRDGRIAMSAVWPSYGDAPRLSADLRCSVLGVQLFSEVASEPFRGCFATTGGLVTSLGEHWKAAMRLTAVPSSYSHKKYGEYGVSGVLSFRAGSYVSLRGRTGFGSSEIRHQGAVFAAFSALPEPGGNPRRMVQKAKFRWQMRISPSLRLEALLSERWRNYSNERLRAELRTTLGWSDGTWTLESRLHCAWCDSPGALLYAEALRSGKLISVALRGTVFHTGGWASRIYAYERDAPGGFNVPAYYGTGWALNAVLSARRDWHRVSLRTFARLYYVQKKSGPSSGPGLSLQVSLAI